MLLTDFVAWIPLSQILPREERDENVMQEGGEADSWASAGPNKSDVRGQQLPFGLARVGWKSGNTYFRTMWCRGKNDRP
jgi:hypothetical protein